MSKNKAALGAAIVELSKANSEIEKMVGVVRHISAKTDLLAMNASIEAARAGEAGKRFGVVADEITELAEKAQESLGMMVVACHNLKRHIASLAQETQQEHHPHCCNVEHPH